MTSLPGARTLAGRSRRDPSRTWEGLHEIRRRTFRILRARPRGAGVNCRADLGLTGEPGKTTSSGMIATVAEQHPRMAIDFVRAHLAQGNDLIEISGRFMGRLSAGSDNAV